MSDLTQAADRVLKARQDIRLKGVDLVAATSCKTRTPKTPAELRPFLNRIEAAHQELTYAVAAHLDLMEEGAQ